MVPRQDVRTQYGSSLSLLFSSVLVLVFFSQDAYLVRKLTRNPLFLLQLSNLNIRKAARVWTPSTSKAATSTTRSTSVFFTQPGTEMDTNLCGLGAFVSEFPNSAAFLILVSCTPYSRGMPSFFQIYTGSVGFTLLFSVLQVHIESQQDLHPGSMAIKSSVSSTHTFECLQFFCSCR